MRALGFFDIVIWGRIYIYISCETHIVLTKKLFYNVLIMVRHYNKVSLAAKNLLQYYIVT